MFSSTLFSITLEDTYGVKTVIYKTSMRIIVYKNYLLT